MNIISFCWTSEAIINKSKTETRRFWKDSHAEKFRVGTAAIAVKKLYGGEKICPIYITAIPYRERLSDMSDESFIAEGGTRYWKDKEEYIQMMLAQGKGDMPYRVQFGYFDECKNGSPLWRRNKENGIIYEPVICPKCFNTLKHTLSTKYIEKNKTTFINHYTCPKCDYKYDLEDTVNGLWKLR